MKFNYMRKGCFYEMNQWQFDYCRAVLNEDSSVRITVRDLLNEREIQWFSLRSSVDLFAKWLPKFFTTPTARQMSCRKSRHEAKIGRFSSIRRKFWISSFVVIRQLHSTSKFTHHSIKLIKFVDKQVKRFTKFGGSLELLLREALIRKLFKGIFNKKFQQQKIWVPSCCLAEEESSELKFPRRLNIFEVKIPKHSKHTSLELLSSFVQNWHCLTWRAHAALPRFFITKNQW